MKLSREIIQRMVTDRVGSGGGGGGSAISIDDIQGMGFATEQWVNEKYLSIDFFNRLFQAYDSAATPNQVLPNDLESTITNIKAMFGFWTEQFVSALGYGPGGGGGGDTLTEPLASINNAGLGMPTVANVGIVWDGSQWTYGSTGGGGGGTDLAAVWSSIAGSTDSYANTKINASHIPGVYMKADNSGDYVAVKFASNMPDELAASTDNGWIEWWQSDKWMNHAMGHLILADSSSQIRTYNGTLFNLPNSGGTLALVGDIPALGISNGVITIGNNTITPVTQVAMTVPTGFTISGSPVTKSGTLALGFTNGYSLPTTAKQSQWDTAYSERHTHSNKSVLDGITSTKVSNWDTAYSERHTHSNKSVLDGITSTKVSNWDTAYGWGNHANAGYMLRTEGMRFLAQGTYIAARFATASGATDTARAAYAQGDGYIEWWSSGGYFNHEMGFIRAKGNVTVGTGNTDTTHYLQIGGGRLFWDNTNNALYVQKADGTACHLYATGGVSALGMSVGGTPSMNALTLQNLTVNGSATINTLAVTNEIETLDVNTMHVTNELWLDGNSIYMDGGNIEDAYQVQTTQMIVGSGGSTIKKIYWDGTYLQVQIGTKIYKFTPDQTSNA